MYHDIDVGMSKLALINDAYPDATPENKVIKIRRGLDTDALRFCRQMYNPMRVMDEFKSYNDILNEEKAKTPQQNWQKNNQSSFQSNRPDNSNKPFDNRQQSNKFQTRNQQKEPPVNSNKGKAPARGPDPRKQTIKRRLQQSTGKMVLSFEDAQGVVGVYQFPRWDVVDARITSAVFVGVHDSE